MTRCMSTFKRILLATDFSACSAQATEYATTLAKQSGATVVLTHVYTAPVVYLPEGMWTMPGADAETRRQLNEALEKGAAALKAAGVPAVDTVLIDGLPGQEIPRLAADRACDLIVIGTHGRGGVSHFLLGSVAEKVVRKAHCPVLTVRGTK